MEKNYSDNAKYIKYFLYLAVLFVFITYLHDLAKTLITSDFIDIRHYYVNSKLLQQGIDPWKISTPEYLSYLKAMIPQSGYAAYANILHSMGFFLIFSPFTRLEFFPASVLWVMACQSAFLVSVWLILTRIIQSLDIQKTLTGLFLALIFWPLREDLYLGQPNLLILFFLCLALICFKNKNIFLAGVLLGCAIQIKEIFLPILLFTARKSYWKAMAGAGCVIFLFKTASILNFGLDKEISYWANQLSFFTPQFSAHGYVDISNLSLMYLLRNFSFGIANIVVIRTAAIVISLLALARGFQVLYKGRSGRDWEREQLEFSFFIVLCLMVGPWVHETHLVVLILPLLISWSYISKEPIKKSPIILFIAAYLILGLKYSISSFPEVYIGPFAFLLSFKSIGYVMLFVLSDNLLRGKNEA